MFNAHDLQPLMSSPPQESPCSIEVRAFDDQCFNPDKRRYGEVEIEIHQAERSGFTGPLAFWRASIDRIPWTKDFRVKSGGGLFKPLKLTVEAYNKSNAVYMKGLIGNYPKCCGRFIAAMTMRLDWNEDVSLIQTDAGFYAFYWHTLA